MINETIKSIANYYPLVISLFTLLKLHPAAYRIWPALRDSRTASQKIAILTPDFSTYEISGGGISSTDIVYGFLKDKHFYELRYSALQTHYFIESLDEFEEVVRHFKTR